LTAADIIWFLKLFSDRMIHLEKKQFMMIQVVGGKLLNQLVMTLVLKYKRKSFQPLQIVVFFDRYVQVIEFNLICMQF